MPFFVFFWVVFSLLSSQIPFKYKLQVVCFGVCSSLLVHLPTMRSFPAVTSGELACQQRLTSVKMTLRARRDEFPHPVEQTGNKTRANSRRAEIPSEFTTLFSVPLTLVDSVRTELCWICLGGGGLLTSTWGVCTAPPQRITDPSPNWSSWRMCQLCVHTHLMVANWTAQNTSSGVLA